MIGALVKLRFATFKYEREIEIVHAEVESWISQLSAARRIVFLQIGLQFLHFFDQAQEFFTEVGQPIFHTGWDLRELFPLENPGAGEVLQTVAQDLGADALDVTFDGAGPVY